MSRLLGIPFVALTLILIGVYAQLWNFWATSSNHSFADWIIAVGVTLLIASVVGITSLLSFCLLCWGLNDEEEVKNL